MDLMFSLTVRRIAGYRNELGDYYSNRTFCHISMGDNGNTEVDDFATVYQNVSRDIYRKLSKRRIDNVLLPKNKCLFMN